MTRMATQMGAWGLWLGLFAACEGGGDTGPGPAFLPDGSTRDALVVADQGLDAAGDAARPLVDQGTDAPPGDAALADAAPDAAPGDAATDAASAVDAEADATPPAPDAGMGMTCHTVADPLPGLELVRSGRFLRAEAVASAHVRPRGLTIYLPADYDAKPDQVWPVLYVHDGQNLFDPREAAFGVAWELDEAVDALVAAQVIEPLIVVGVHNTADRVHEYTPSVDPGRGQGGGAMEYGRFLVEELKPALDVRLRTSCARSETGLMGSSLGGLVSFWLLAAYPDVFGRVGVVSPSFWWNGQEAFGWVPVVQQGFGLDSRLWIDAGGGEGHDDNRDGRSSVIEDSRGVAESLELLSPEQIGYLEVPGALHNEQAWQERAPAILAYLFGNDPGAPADLRIQLHSPPLQRVPVMVSVHADWAWHRLTLLNGQAEWDGPVAGGVLRAEPGARRLHAHWRGQEAVVQLDPPAAAQIELLVRVPDGTRSPVYITGGPAQIGAWDPAGLLLDPVPGGFGRTFAVPAGVPFEFKITRGSWETVEKGPGGEELENRQAAAVNGPLEVRVARWADSP